MKHFAKCSLLFIVSLSVVACSQVDSSSTKQSKEPEPSFSSESSSELSSSSIFSYSLPEKEQGVSLETFTEEINKLEAQTNNRKIRISYHIVETLVGSVPNATFRSGNDPLPEGETITDLVLESRNDSASDLKLISGEASTRFSQTFTSGIMIGIKNWLSYHKERRSAMEKESMQGWSTFKESLNINPFKMWMLEAGNKPANSGVEGNFYEYNEYERTFDENGYCQTLLFRDYTYIDGVYSRWDTDPKQYKGTFDAVATATIEYLDQQ